MNKRKLQGLFSVLFLLAVVVFPLQMGQAKNQTQADLAASSKNDKIDPTLLSRLGAKGRSDFVIEMGFHADLSAAYQMDWKTRGVFVYKTLQETALQTQKEVIAILGKRGLKYQSFFAGNEVMVFQGDLDTALEAANLVSVKYIRAPITVTIAPSSIFTVEIGPEYSSPKATVDWGLTDVKAPNFWSTFSVQGAGVVVANIDTGVQWNHPALIGAYKCGSDPSDPACWYDPSNVCAGGAACDNNGHGTHTMGTMVGSDDPGLAYTVGMAPEAKWIACKGCESTNCSDLALNACADWILAPDGDPANRPHIVNNSWGGGGGETWYLSKVQAWRAAGIFPAFSAGNSGSGCSTIGSPGDYQESFASANHNSSRSASGSSSRGPSFFGHAPYTKPNISAPGTSICSTVPTNGWDCSYSGTSMASPHVAGAVALLWSCNADLVGEIDTTFQLLQDTADAPSAGNCSAPPDGEGNYTFGYGYLNVLAAGNSACNLGELTGSVSDGSLPIPGATVTADNGAGLVTNTTSQLDGSYALNLPQGTYTVSAVKYAYTEDTETGVVITKDTTTVVNFTLTQLETTHVNGTVYDGGEEGGVVHGYPLYARINISTPDMNQTIYTDPLTGYYEVDLVAGVDHNFEISAIIQGYEILSETVTPAYPGTTHDITLHVPGCSAPGYLPGYDFYYNFEDSNQGFTTSGTTTFEWGTPTSGPGSAHSGINVWGTNLSGDYNNNENGYLISPEIDLTSLGVKAPVVEWWQWLVTEASYDFASVEVTKDGGVSWDIVYPEISGTVDPTWTKHTVLLDPSYAVADFQMRFHFRSDISLTYAGWYIDDIGIFGITAPAETVVYQQTFESNDGGFTHTGANDEWEWGTPTTTFPGGCGEGLKCWDTDLDGLYENNTNAQLNSPMVDLSGVSLPPNNHLYLSWQQAIYIENAFFDQATAMISSDGLNWTTLWEFTGSTRQEGWNTKSYDITSFAGKTVYLRFLITSDYALTFEGWSIDDIKIWYLEATQITSPACELIPGGVVTGKVVDAVTGDPFIGADVFSDTASTHTEVYDPANPGIYWLFQHLESKTLMDISASVPDHPQKTLPVDVQNDGVVWQVFEMGVVYRVHIPWVNNW
jgi:subtilisin family serine protease